VRSAQARTRRDDLLPPDFVSFAATFGIAFFVTILAAVLPAHGRS